MIAHEQASLPRHAAFRRIDTPSLALVPGGWHSAPLEPIYAALVAEVAS